ncbi:NAD(P)-binding protein [Apiospora sp. TS-2023a]
MGGLVDWADQDGTPQVLGTLGFGIDVSTSLTPVTHLFAPLLPKSSNPRLRFLTSGQPSLQRTRDDFQPNTTLPPAGWPKDDDLRPDFYMMKFRPRKTDLKFVDEQVGRARGPHDLRDGCDEGARARAPAQGLTVPKLSNSTNLQNQRNTGDIQQRRETQRGYTDSQGSARWRRG